MAWLFRKNKKTNEKQIMSPTPVKAGLGLTAAEENSSYRNDELQIVSKCLQELLDGRILKEHQLNRFYNQMTYENFDLSNIIIKQGEKGNGIYIILSGKVEILETVDGENLLISEKINGDYFGEVSTIYDINSTATAQAATRCKLLFMQKKNFKKLAKGSRTSLVDWFVQKRYIPTKTQGLEDRQVVRRLVLQVLSNLPLLKSYDQETLKSFIISMLPDLVVIYPANSCIIYNDDPSNRIFVIITGSVRLKNQGEEIQIDVDHRPIVLGEEDYFKRRKHTYSAFSKTICQIIAIKRERLDKLLSEKVLDTTNSLKWNLSEEFMNILNITINSIYRNVCLNQHFEVLQYMISQSDPFKTASTSLLYYITLNCHLICLHTRELYHVEENGYEGLLLIVSGEVETVNNHMIVNQQKLGDVISTDEVRILKNKTDTNVTIVLLTRECLMNTTPHQTRSDKDIPVLKNMIVKFNTNHLTSI